MNNVSPLRSARVDYTVTESLEVRPAKLATKKLRCQSIDPRARTDVALNPIKVARNISPPRKLPRL